MPTTAETVWAKQQYVREMLARFPDGGYKLNTQNHPITGSPIENLLPRLDQVKVTGPGRWKARCPSHADENPSFSVKETDDGTILVKCWSGCSALEIMQAVGLSLADLFPRQSSHHHKKQTYYSRQLPDYRKLLSHLKQDLTIVVIAAADVARGEFKQADMPALANTTKRLRQVLEAANV